MSKTFDARRLDVAAFARLHGHLAGTDLLQKYERLAQELQAPAANLTVNWQADGGERKAIDGSLRPAIHLRADATLPLTCQRCMGEVETPVTVDRHFVFVDDEDRASALDDESDDDVLVAAPDFNLHALIEDELLMALPLVPRHAHCPQPVKMSVGEEELKEAEVPVNNPFAALAGLPPHKPKH